MGQKSAKELSMEDPPAEVRLCFCLSPKHMYDLYSDCSSQFSESVGDVRIIYLPTLMKVLQNIHVPGTC